MANRQSNKMSRRQFILMAAGAGSGALILASNANLAALARLQGTDAATMAATAGAVRDAIAASTIVSQGPQIDVAKYKKDGPYRIGFSNGFSGNSWRAMMLASLDQEKAKHPEIKEIIIVDGQGDVTKQVNDIESLISQNVDVIMTIPNSGTAVAPVLRRATQQGILTVPFNLPVDGEDYVAYIGTDPASKGQRLGEWLRDALGGKGKIVALGGLPGNSYTATAWGAAEKVLKAAGIEVLTFRDAYWEEDRAKVVMADLITAYPQIDGIWADGGQVAAGASKALLAAKRPLIPVTGDDYNGLLKLYADNSSSQSKFNFGLLAEPTWESALALRTAVNILKGQATTKLQVIQPAFITTTNYKDVIRPSLPDGVFVDNDLPEELLKTIFKAS